jgi:C4-dicarboxylate transporter DctQ subunit
MAGNRFITKLHKIFDSIVDCAAFISGTILAFSTLLVCADIIMRYFFNSPIPGVLETTEFGLLFFTLLASAWLMRRNKHVNMDLVLHKLKPRIQCIMNACTFALCAVICAVITYYGALTAIDRYQTNHRLSTALEPLSYPLVSIIPVCFFLLFIQSTIMTYNYILEANTLQAKNKQSDNLSRGLKEVI